MNQPTKKNSSNTTQAVISSDQQFILAKKMNEFTDVICPFSKIDNGYYTKFFLPISQLHRIHMLYEVITGISKYTVSDNMISFDCIRKLPDYIFGNVDEGYIHYTSVIEKKKQSQTEISVEPKLIFSTVENEPINITFDQKIKFKSDYLKAFPIILKSGFIFSTVDQQTCQLYLSLLRPSERFIGESSKYEINNLIQYILPLWSIFEININKTIQIRLREDFIKNTFKSNNTPILISATYSLSNPENITLKHIGNYIKID